MAAFVSLIKKLFNDRHLPIFFDQKQNVGWLLLNRFVDLVRACYLHISRKHPNMLLLVNLQETKTCPK